MRRSRRERRASRHLAFLQTKCSVCNTPTETPSREMPCCRVFLHEKCLVDSFDHTSGTWQHICPHCGAMLIPLNDGEQPPFHDVPEGSHVFHFKHIRFVSRVESHRGATSRLEEPSETTYRLTEPPEANCQSKKPPKATCNLKEQPEATCKLKEPPEATYRLKDPPEATSRSEEPPETTCRLKETPQATSRLVESVEATCRLKDPPEPEATSRLEESSGTSSRPEARPRKRRRFRKKQAELRRDAFLQTKCYICHTPKETPSRRSPCCGYYVHEECLVGCLEHIPEQHKCPHCRGTLFLLNDDEEFPPHIPEDSNIFLLFHVQHNRCTTEVGSSLQGTVL